MNRRRKLGAHRSRRRRAETSTRQVAVQAKRAGKEQQLTGLLRCQICRRLGRRWENDVSTYSIYR